MKRIIIIISSISALLVISNCKTDFDLNAPYDSVPVVYGVLDQSTDTQYVKINKSFIGTGNNAEYASILDSNLYQTLSGSVDEYVNGSMTQSFPLQEKWVYDIEDGIFNTDSQKVYYFLPASGLNENATYKLNVTVSEESSPITAETELIEGSALTFGNVFNLQTSINGIKFADAQTITTNNYSSVTPDWAPVKGGKIYELYMRFNYNEITATDTIKKTIEWNLGSQTTSGTDGNDPTMTKTIEGESFYNMIKSRLDNYSNESNVIKRKIINIQFLLAAGADDLNTYINVNKPATGVVTEKPTFTNIDGGVGIFSSRMNITTTSNLDVHSTYVLCKGDITGGFKFCTDSTDFLVTYPDLTCN